MITIIDEKKMTLRNYDDFMQLNNNDMACYMVDYNWSLDRKPIINFFTLEMNSAYNSDII